MGSFLIGNSSPSKIFLGTSVVKAIYLGTSLIWENALWVLYNNGLISGVTWSGNVLPREQYTGSGKVNSATLTSGNYMQAFIDTSASSTAVSQNSHIISTDPITVPINATTLKVQASYTSGQPSMNFGLLPSNAPTSVSTANGGQLTGYQLVTTSKIDYSLTLNDSIKGTNNFYLVINCKGNSGSGTPRRNLNIHKIWFE